MNSRHCIKFASMSRVLALACAVAWSASCPAAQSKDPTLAVVYDYTNAPAGKSGPADLIIYDAQVITVDPKFSIEKAVAIRGDKILAVGNWQLEKYQGPDTRMLDAHGATILPGLYDSHVHSYKAAISEIGGPLPVLDSIAAAQDYIRKEAAAKKPGSWIVLERLYPTRLKEGRFPTLAELDEAAPNNPVYWNCGPVSLANSKALEVSRITGDTPDPRDGEIARNPKTRKPTGLLRNAASLLKLPPPAH